MSTIATKSTILTVDENSGKTLIGIAAPADTKYSSSQLTILVKSLPTDGTIYLANGSKVYAGEKLSVKQLTNLYFKPNTGLFGTSSTFSYTVSDPAGTSVTGTATLAIAPDSLPPTTTPVSLTVSENSAPTTIGVAAPTDPNYAASQLSITVTGLPSDGTVYLADKVTVVTMGEALTVAQLTGLTFAPTAGVFSTTSQFSYTVIDPAGLSAAGSAALTVGAAIAPDAGPTTTSASLTVAENAGPTSMTIMAPADPNFAPSQLSVKVTGLPTNGTVFLSDGVTKVAAGEALSIDQLTGLDFAPSPGLSAIDNQFTYVVTDPSGSSANGVATVAIAPVGRILTVGAGQQYSTIGAAIAASQNGDTIQVQAGTYINDFATINDSITLEGVGGMVNMVCTEQIPNGKAILVTNGNDTINNFSFSGAQVAPADDNGAGIRWQAGNLVLNDDYFFNNEEGLLGGPSGGSLTINYSEFANNGVSDPTAAGYGYTHNLYVGNAAQVTINNSYFHGVNIGHEIKSRALNTTIENSVIEDGPSGTGSFDIDLPNGGNAVIQNNFIEKGALAQNSVSISIGEEGVSNPTTNLQFSGNTILNDLSSASSLGVRNASTAVVQIFGNRIYGLAAGQIAAGPNSQSNNAFLTTEPPLLTTSPWSA